MPYRYCILCGGQLTKKSEDLYICSQCGHHFYVSPKSSNAVILENSKGEILLVKRKGDPKKGWWDLPGGFIDIEETIEESVIREIKEELGINLKNIRYLSSHPDRYLYDGDNYYMLNLIFSAELVSDEIKVSDDITGYEFFPKDKIPFERIAFPSLAAALKDYIK